MNITEEECYCDEMDYGPFSPKCPVCLEYSIENSTVSITKGSKNERKTTKDSYSNFSYYNYHYKHD